MVMDAEVNTMSSVQEAVVQAAAQVLALDHVDPSHNFFELGGSSLSVALVTEQLESVLGIECPMQLLYENPVLADFAETLRKRQTDSNQASSPT